MSLVGSSQVAVVVAAASTPPLSFIICAGAISVQSGQQCMVCNKWQLVPCWRGVVTTCFTHSDNTMWAQVATGGNCFGAGVNEAPTLQWRVLLHQGKYIPGLFRRALLSPLVSWARVLWQDIQLIPLVLFRGTAPGGMETWQTPHTIQS